MGRKSQYSSRELQENLDTLIYRAQKKIVFGGGNYRVFGMKSAGPASRSLAG